MLEELSIEPNETFEEVDWIDNVKKELGQEDFNIVCEFCSPYELSQPTAMVIRMKQIFRAVYMYNSKMFSMEEIYNITRVEAQYVKAFVEKIFKEEYKARWFSPYFGKQEFSRKEYTIR